MNKKFICCTDKETIEKLKQANFQLVSEFNGIATFVNDVTKPVLFDKKKVAYTNNVLM